MKVLKVFFLGLIYGWFMRWIIDEIYTRDQLRIITNENILLRERLESLETPKALEPLSIKQKSSPPKPGKPAPASKPVQRTSGKDDLKKIKGVGPQFEKKLNNAGVHTFEQMSQLTIAKLQGILGISKRSVHNADNLIAQAKKFSQQKTKR